jgi:DsbC/DsbD-like thiol-disulfide interchange protein
MKKIILMLLLSAAVSLLHAQVMNPAHWSYGLKKLDGDHYEVHLRATMDEGWHIYAQKQLPDAVAVPTKIVFTKAPGLKLKGLPLELGKKEKYTIKEAGVTNMEYAGVVDFVQKVTLTPGLKEVKGTITYQTCTHEMCLPEATISFSIAVP